MYDVIIVGGGPAGISAALTLRARGKQTAIVGKGAAQSSLAKAERIENYPGVPSVSGKALLEIMTEQARAQSVEFIEEKALSAMPMGDMLFVSAGQNVLETRALILAGGVSRGKALPGEAELLGAGVSYCATCDGMLYRGKRVAVLGYAADAPEEAEFLRGVGCEVLYYDGKDVRGAVIHGEGRVEALEIGGETVPVDGVFVLRDSVSPEAFLPGLALDGSHIATQRDLSTNIPGVFAAGDCVGTPYQITKAVGDGNVAALSAVKYLDELKKKANTEKE